jgi:hypothetical protein
MKNIGTWFRWRPAAGILATLVLLVFLVPESAGADTPSAGRRQVWAMQIAKLVKEPPGWTAVERHETGALAFSPDDKLLAVTLGHVQRVSQRNILFNTHVFVVDVASPEANVRQFDLTQTCGVDLSWNERGDMMLVCGVILRPADGTLCAVSSPPPGYPSLSREFGANRAYWLDSDQVVRWDGRIVDLTCKQVGTWPLEPGWQISAVAPSKGWILQWHNEGPREKVVCQYSIVDRTSHEALMGWPSRESPCGANMKLSVGAGAVCSSLYSENIANSRLHCQAVDGRMEIPVPKQVRGYVLEQAATSSARVVVEKWEYDRDPWWELLLTWWVPDPGGPPLPRQRAAFDLGSGRLIASWKPRIQDSRSPHGEDWPYHFALSASGDFLAEGGDGVLELYSLVP